MLGTKGKTGAAALVLAAVLAAPIATGWIDAAAAQKPLVDYKVVGGYSIPQPLTDKPGDPEHGLEVMVDRKLGNCLACHKVPGVDAPFQGEVGPSLAGVGSARSEGELRLQVVNPKALNPASVMPAFYKVEGLHRVMEKFQGQPILTAQQVEDVVAYLKTMK